MSEQKITTPGRLIIDGTEHRIVSRHPRHGFRRHYEILVGKDQLKIILPPRLFCLFATLAILRDAPLGESYDSEERRGYVHQDRVGLSKSLINQYVYHARDTVRRQAHQALFREEITQEEFDLLVRWPVFESGYRLQLWCHWRCVIDPANVFLGDAVMQFPSSNLVDLAHEFYRRRGVNITQPQPS